MTLKRTSHFIGFKLKSEAFVDLFVQLQQFLQQNDLKECIELQNILSIHTTLYYFESDIPAEVLTALKDFIATHQDNEGNFTISINGFDYFNRDGKEVLLHLKPENESLVALHTQLATQFKRDAVVDNQYPFVPHVTLFKILDLDTYEKYRSQIERIVNQCIQEMNSMNIYEELRVFAVYSQAKPEMQISL